MKLDFSRIKDDMSAILLAIASGETITGVTEDDLRTMFALSDAIRTLTESNLNKATAKEAKATMKTTEQATTGNPTDGSCHSHLYARPVVAVIKQDGGCEATQTLNINVYGESPSASQDGEACAKRAATNANARDKNVRSCANKSKDGITFVTLLE